MSRARELRFAFTFDDHDAALRLFRDVLGLETLEHFEGRDGHGVILRVPSATLELFDPAYGALVDEIEVGAPLGERVRIAARVDELAPASRDVRAAGATPLADPVDTPWGDRNQRFRVAGSLQLTLFEPPP